MQRFMSKADGDGVDLCIGLGHDKAPLDASSLVRKSAKGPALHHCIGPEISRERPCPGDTVKRRNTFVRRSARPVRPARGRGNRR